MLLKIAFALISCSFLYTSFSQDVKKDSQKTETKMDVLASKTGVIVKFIDYEALSFLRHS